MGCQINRIWIQSGHQANVNARCERAPGLVSFFFFSPPLLILFSIKKQPSQAFLQCSGAESQPSPPVPVTEGYCCHRTMPSVTEHSCLFISKTEMLKGNVRWERERTSRYKISRRRKQEEEHGGLPITKWLSQLPSWKRLLKCSGADGHKQDILWELTTTKKPRGVASFKFDKSRLFHRPNRAEENNLVALI